MLAIGATSLVGVALSRRGDLQVIDCAAPSDANGVRVEEPGELDRLISRLLPDTILYCHAVCDVGRCQDEPEWAQAVNVGGVQNLLDAVGPETRIVYLSS